MVVDEALLQPVQLRGLGLPVPFWRVGWVVRVVVDLGGWLVSVIGWVVCLVRVVGWVVGWVLWVGVDCPWSF